MTGDALDLDALIPRLRARAADPGRRTSAPPSRFVAGVRTLDLGGMLGLGRAVAGDLGRVVAASRQGRVDAAGHAHALELERELTTPAPSVLPAPADESAIVAAEVALGVRLPAALRRVYGEVADGGFGPGEGLLPLTEVVRAWHELREPGQLPRGRTWPVGLLPLVEMSPGWDCVDAATGAVIAWDPEELTERSSEDRFRRSFHELFPTVEDWLGDWVGSKTEAEKTAEMMQQAQVQAAREARAAIGRMTPEERAKMGLPEVGWERVVWGGLGWDEDEGGG